MSEPSDVIDRSEVTVYWRPGCPYCSRLRRDLHRLGLPVTEVNIWEDPAGSAIVRSAAGGNETVPTVIVGSTALVNPSAKAVVETMQAGDPDRPVDDQVQARLGRIQNVRIVKWAVLAAIIAGSFTADATGRSGLSWGLDALALAVWAAFRVIGR
jgi:glutaredoxin-like protein